MKLKLLIFLSITLKASLIIAEPNPSSYQSFFREKLILVSESRDGLYPHNLRSALMQASSLRDKEPFSRIRIYFSPSLQKVEITKGSLPTIDGSWTTLDCRKPRSSVALEYKPQDPELQGPAMLQLFSFNNMIYGCQIQMSQGVAIAIRGNDNQILENQISFAAPARSGTKRNSANIGIQIEEDSQHNLIQNNQFEGPSNAYGILMKPGIGSDNRVFSNIFKNHPGTMIKVFYNNAATNPPKELKTSQTLNQWQLEGKSVANTLIEAFVYQPESHLLGPSLGSVRTPKSGEFLLALGGQNLTAGFTQIAALATTDQKNTSELSEAVVLVRPSPESAEPIPPETATKEEVTPKKPAPEKLEEIPNDTEPLDEALDKPTWKKPPLFPQINKED